MLVIIVVTVKTYIDAKVKSYFGTLVLVLGLSLKLLNSSKYSMCKCKESDKLFPSDKMQPSANKYTRKWLYY